MCVCVCVCVSVSVCLVVTSALDDIDLWMIKNDVQYESLITKLSFGYKLNCVLSYSLTLLLHWDTGVSVQIHFHFKPESVLLNA